MVYKILWLQGTILGSIRNLYSLNTMTTTFTYKLVYIYTNLFKDKFMFINILEAIDNKVGSI